VVRCDRLDEQAVVRRPQRLGRLLAEPGALRGLVDEVGEEDRRGPRAGCGRLRWHRPRCLRRGLLGGQELDC